MSDTALEVILGSIFAILGLGLIIRRKRLSKSKYYRYLTIIIAILFLGFAAFMAIRALTNE